MGHCGVITDEGVRKKSSSECAERTIGFLYYGRTYFLDEGWKGAYVVELFHPGCTESDPRLSRYMKAKVSVLCRSFL